MQAKRDPKNILVTGGAGFIGSAFIRYLLKNVPFYNGRCINLDSLTYAGNPENLGDLVHDRRYTFIHGDIRNADLVENVCTRFNVDTIIHLAAESHVDRSIHHPQDFLETNILGTFSLLETVKRHNHIHFHHVSTDEVYGCLGETGKFTEETAYKPNSPYSASKAASDHLVRAYAVTYGLSTCISNCSNNYGPYQFPEKLIPLMILNCLEGESLPVYGEGKNVRDWLYVDDHAAALWLLLNEGGKGETYNIGGEAEYRNIDIVHKIIETVSHMTGKPRKDLTNLITYVKDRPGHDFRYAIDCSKIKNELGWKPEHTFKQGLHDTVEWYINHKEWVRHIQTGSYRQWIEKNYAGR